MAQPELVRRAPAAPLRGLVGSYYGFREEAPGPVLRQEGPGGEVVVVLSFDTDWWVGHALEPRAAGVEHRSFVGGLHDAQVLTRHGGRSAGMQLNLAPPAARALFRVGMDELAGRTVALADVLRPGAELLVERLQEARDWDERFRLLDRTLAIRFAAAPPASAEMTWACRRLRASRGRLRVEALAGELGWSRKRLAARFREHVGVSPKTLARILRFEHALERAARGGTTWTELALACGYADQSHLVHEFRAFTGKTPTAYAPFLQDAGALGA